MPWNILEGDGRFTSVIASRLFIFLLLFFLLSTTLLVEVLNQLLDFVFLWDSDINRWNEILIDVLEEDKCCLLESFNLTAKDVVQVILNMGFQDIFTEVWDTNEKCFTHLLKHLDFKLLKTTRHIGSLLLYTSIEPHGPIFDSLHEDTDDRLRKLFTLLGPAKCLLNDFTKLN